MSSIERLRERTAPLTNRPARSDRFVSARRETPDARRAGEDDARRSAPTRSSDGAPTARAQRAKTVKAAFWLNLALVLGSYYAHHGTQGLDTGTGIALMLGRTTGLVATYLMVVQMLLVGRNPWLDRLFGMDRLTRMHARLGRIAFTLLAVHVVATTWAYAGAKIAAVPHEINTLVLHTPHMLLATIAFAFICAVVVTSIRLARRRLRYQTWLFVHFYAYLGIALAVPHEIFLGSDFVNHPLTQAHWVVIYGTCVGSLLYFRFWQPLRMSLRHRLRVEAVIHENATTTTIYITGQDLGDLHAQSGQFMIWRFLDRSRWTEAHPYSLSAAPNGQFLRITVKALGDSSESLRNLKPGTRVMAEGPYGAFTAQSRTRRKVVLIAGGVGITPIRALAETFPARRGDITLMYRSRSAKDVVFAQELEELSSERGIKVQIITGDRSQFDPHTGPFSPRHFMHATPDIADSDIYICGPHALTSTVICSLKSLGVTDAQIHHESFEY